MSRGKPGTGRRQDGGVSSGDRESAPRTPSDLGRGESWSTARQDIRLAGVFTPALSEPADTVPGMTIEEPRGARTHAIPLPQGREVKRAINSLNTGLNITKPPGQQHPMGDRGYAAQYLGMLKGIVAQMEEGLRGGPLQTDVQKGWFGAYERNLPSMFANTAAQFRDLSEFARQGIHQAPHASQQMSVAAVALRTAAHAFAAAAEIAVGVGSPDFDDNEVVKESEAMYEAFDLLADYVAKKRAEFGEG